MHSLLHRLHHASIFQNILSSYSMLASWCWKTKAKNNNKSWRNTQKDNRQKEASPISLTTSLLSSAKRQGHGYFTDARCSVIALPPQAMQAVAFCTASLFAMLWIQKWMFPSSKIPEPSNELSIMHGVGDTMDCISHLYLIALWLDPHTVDRPVNLAVCGWHGVTYEEWNILHYRGTATSLPGHCYCSTTALPQHYQDTITALPLHTAGRDTVTCSPAGHCDEDVVACREERFHAAPSPGMTTHSFVGCEHNRHWMYAWRVSSLQTTASGVFSTRLYVVVLVVAFLRWTRWGSFSISALTNAFHL